MTQLFHSPLHHPSPSLGRGPCWQKRPWPRAAGHKQRLYRRPARNPACARAIVALTGALEPGGNWSCLCKGPAAGGGAQAAACPGHANAWQAIWPGPGNATRQPEPLARPLPSRTGQAGGLGACGQHAAADPCWPQLEQRAQAGLAEPNCGTARTIRKPVEAAVRRAGLDSAARQAVQGLLKRSASVCLAASPGPSGKTATVGFGRNAGRGSQPQAQPARSSQL